MSSDRDGFNPSNDPNLELRGWLLILFAVALPLAMAFAV